jgi:hypothetical protein
MDKIFTTITLSDGKKCDILEGTGAHWFEAVFMAGSAAIKNTNILSIYMCIAMMRINGERVTVDQYKALPIRDVIAITDAINAQHININRL